MHCVETCLQNTKNGPPCHCKRLCCKFSKRHFEVVMTQQFLKSSNFVTANYSVVFTFQETEKAAFLVRQHIHYSLYDRIR